MKDKRGGGSDLLATGEEDKNLLLGVGLQKGEKNVDLFLELADEIALFQFFGCDVELLLVNRYILWIL